MLPTRRVYQLDRRRRRPSAEDPVLGTSLRHSVLAAQTVVPSWVIAITIGLLL
jgi:hypothetical protein